MFPTEEFDYLIVSGGGVKFLLAEIEEHCKSYRKVEGEPTESDRSIALIIKI